MIVYYGMVRRGGVYNSGNDDYRRHYLHNYHHCIDEFPLRVHNLKTPMDNQYGQLEGIIQLNTQGCYNFADQQNIDALGKQGVRHRGNTTAADLVSPLAGGTPQSSLAFPPVVEAGEEHRAATGTFHPRESLRREEGCRRAVEL